MWQEISWKYLHRQNVTKRVTSRATWRLDKDCGACRLVSLAPIVPGYLHGTLLAIGELLYIMGPLCPWEHEYTLAVHARVMCGPREQQLCLWLVNS